MRSFMRLALLRMSAGRNNVNTSTSWSINNNQIPQSELLAWIESKIINKALPGNEGDFLYGWRRATETELLQVQQRVDEGTTSVQELWRTCTNIQDVLLQAQFVMQTHLNLGRGGQTLGTPVQL